MAPNTSLVVHGNFNPENTVGPINGKVEVVAKHGPTVTLNFQGEIKPDTELKTDQKITITNIDNQASIVASSPLLFTTKSGVTIDPNKVSINGECYIGANLEVNDNHLYVTPYIYVPSLPNYQRGCTVLTVNFKYDIGILTYDIPINWERNDPLRITKIAPGSYAISYTDNCRFNIRKLIVRPELTYETHFNNDGTALFIEQKILKSKPVKQRKRPKMAIAKKQYHFRKTKIKTKRRYSIPRVRTNSTIKQNHHSQCASNLLIQLETTHPYRSEVTINND